ncbi:LLM class flavin-dependent oxidoreductase [Candidatus Hikarchaeum yamanae]|uniref:LLM class flavin-dependent oxidoreductase n=1 Tax=Candidatus Hikarchaeum yamanae TaxID=2675326 RepID=UPI0039ECFBCE|tara:strand:- start:7032 stop:8039 length:1008 start_codon:yes stop_codon:yes gene_type:complete
MRFSVGLLNEYDPNELVRVAKIVDGDKKYKNLFIADERLYKNTYAQMAIVADATRRVGIGTGVTNPYTRHPTLTAAAISTISEISGGRAILGLGAGSPMVLNPLGISQTQPIETVCAATDAIKELIEGKDVTMKSDVFSMENARLNFVSGDRIPIYIAGRGPRILSLAGKMGDGVIAGAGLASVAGMEYAREHIQKGAEDSNRDFDDLDIICWAFLSIADERDTALDSVAEIIARIVKAVPLKTLESIGIPKKDAEKVKRMNDIDLLKLKEIRKILTDGIVEQFAIVGTSEECQSHIEQLIESGVKHIAGLPFENRSYRTEEMIEKFSEEVIQNF